MIADSDIHSIFGRKFGVSPEFIAHAPGRVNLIGEHVDYNGGLVLPAAIDREVRLAARRSDSAESVIYSKEFDESFVFSPGAPPPPGAVDGWRAYAIAVLSRFSARGYTLPALEIVVAGDVPQGAGLSSSAAFTVCIACLYNRVVGGGMFPEEIALLAQESEHCAYINVKCGIMDQFASALGARGMALLLDCHSQEFRRVPLDPALASILVINSMRKRGLVDSKYNERRSQCVAALEAIRAYQGVDYPTLRHVPHEVFARHAEKLDPLAMRRARHVITEIQRVEDFAACLGNSDMEGAGALLRQSHASLRNDFEVSCEELDFIAALATEIPGVFGCRMTGAGFGGCAVALVEPSLANDAAAHFSTRFAERFGLTPDVYLTVPGEGAGVVRV